jgi:uncharacterized protein (DUF305 family)
MPIPGQRLYMAAICMAVAFAVPAAVTGQAPPGPATPSHTKADVRFMQGMIVHHAQAVEMTALVDARSGRADVRLLASRIAMAQEDEMALMRRWLENRHETAPEPGAHGGDHGHHGPGHDLMPGMLDAGEMARLREAAGEEFDRLFLEAMIRHHEGALIMVAELLATDGAAQEPEIFQFASHVESDQRIEIDRMRRLLAAVTAG